MSGLFPINPPFIYAPFSKSAQYYRKVPATRGKRRNVPIDQPFVPFPQRPKPRLQMEPRAHYLTLAQQGERAPGQIPRPHVLLVQTKRGARIVVVPAQVPVPVWPPQVFRVRVNPALLRKSQAHYVEPPWPQASQPGGTTLITRPIMGVGV